MPSWFRTLIMFGVAFLAVWVVLVIVFVASILREQQKMSREMKDAQDDVRARRRGVLR